MIGGGHEANRPPMRRTVRIALVFTALAALIFPMVFVFGVFWSTTGGSSDDLAAEHRGVRYLKPLGSLIAVLTEAGSAAVDEKSVDVARIRSAIAKVDAVDRSDGAALGTRDRWAKLKKQINETLKAEPTGQMAHNMYDSLATPALALVNKVGFTSRLATDRDSDLDATLLQLPGAIVNAGQVARLLRQAAGPADSDGSSNEGGSGDQGSHGAHGGDQAAGDDNSGGDHQMGGSSAAPAGQVAVAMDRVSLARDSIRDGLRFGGAIEKASGLEALDEFSAAVVALLEVVKPATEAEHVPLDEADDASQRVRNAALALHEQMLAAVDGGLTERASSVWTMRLGGAVAGLLGLLLAAVLLWLSLPALAEARAVPTAAPGNAYDHGAGPPSPDQDAMAAAGLIDARELLNSEELLHVGRAVRAVRGEQDDATR